MNAYRTTKLTRIGISSVEEEMYSYPVSSSGVGYASLTRSARTGVTESTISTFIRRAISSGMGRAFSMVCGVARFSYGAGSFAVKAMIDELPMEILEIGIWNGEAPSLLSSSSKVLT